MGQGIEFLTRTGQTCSDVRQEFILLSDVLGVSMLVETINHRALGTPPNRPSWARSTWSSRRRANSATPSPSTARVSRAWSPAGSPAPTATAGRRHRRRVAGQRRGLLRRPATRHPARTQSAGAVHHRRRRSSSGSARIVPRYYPIPDDGPVGDLLARTGRHPNRPGARPLHRHRARPPRSPRTCSSTAAPTSTPMSSSGSRTA